MTDESTLRLLPALPIAIPLATAGLCLLAWRWRTWQRAIALLGAGGLLAAVVTLLRTVWGGRILAVQIGGWPAPFGITLVVDLFAAIMLVLAGLIGLATVVFSLVSVDRRRESFGYYPLVHLLLMGVCGAFATGDIFNLYVWFEVMLMASFVLMALGGERPQIEGAVKYVTINLLASALFLAAVGILYGLAGTLNMADLAVKLSSPQRPGLVAAVASLFLIAFGIKAAIFPLYFWLPASYHTPPVAVSALFAGLLTKVGVYAIIRVFTLIFVGAAALPQPLWLAIAGLTMAVGVLGAYVQDEFRRILSFHIVSQIGYMIMGLALFTPLALAGAVFYIAHHIIVKSNLFLISGLALRLGGTLELKKLGGLWTRSWGLGVLFLIPALSLAGLPPLSGFFAKLILIQAGLAQRQYAIVATALAVGLVTLMSMSKIWIQAFWKPRPAGEPEAGVAAGWTWRSAGSLLLPVAALATLTVIIGLAAGPLFDLCRRSADQLLDSDGYIRAVLGGTP